LEASARPVEPIVLVGGNPALYEELVKDHYQLFRRDRWAPGNRVEYGVGARIRLAGVDNLDHNALHRHDVFYHSLSAVKSHRICRCKRDGMSSVETLKHLAESGRVAERSFRPQSASGRDERANLDFDELVRLRGDPKATLVSNWGLHGTILAARGGD
jgi:hypothetical protein